LIILGPKNQENPLSKKELSKNVEKMEPLYLISLVSGSLGEPMGWAFMGWTNRV
jgi:hypothetical protein